MGFLSNVFDWITGKGSGIVGAGIGAVSSAIQNKKNRDWNAEQAEINRQFQSEESEIARQFNAHEAALQRDWSSQEAERARDWNEEMYEKYNSLSGKIHQAEQAGVNPMFAVTGNAVSPMAASSSAPSGASASGGAPSGSSATASFVDLVGSMLGMSKLKAEIENIQADSKEKNARANKQDKETSWIDSMSEAQLKNLMMSTDKLQSSINVDKETATKLSKESDKLVQEATRIARLTNHEVKKAEADALLADFQTSVYRILDDVEGASTEDYLKAGAFLLEKIIGIGVQLSPRGIVHM